IELTREWITAHDERVRSAHREADGQKRGLKENFIVGGESLLVPGEGSASNSINCRCSVIYEPVI
ncbi:MAG: hypothetical protein JNK65_02475, partial [Deltaproteobacteria bacterium]|nr:hypothetical protein [Deltaproteobacteria bacterium]